MSGCGQAPESTDWWAQTPAGDAAAESGFDASVEASGPDAFGPDASDDAPAADAPQDQTSEPQPPPVPEYSFVVFADTQFATASCTSGVSERLAVPEAILELAPTFMLEAGDLMDHGYEDGAYAQYESCYEGVLGSVPLFPGSGNHDMGSGAIQDFKTFLEKQLQITNAASYGPSYGSDFEIAYEDDPTQYSEDPSNPGDNSDVPSGFSFKTFYAFKYANAYFLSFEQGTRWWSNTPKSWVEKHLQIARQDPEIEHVFVTMHHPMYSSTMAESDSGECYGPVRGYYEALFRQYDVTMVFAGHAHLYDRFYVPDDGHATRQIPSPTTYPHDGEGIHYVVTGGGGGPLNGCAAEKQESSYDFGQGRRCDYHVTQVRVKGGRLDVSIVGVSGSASSHTSEVWESFTIE